MLWSIVSPQILDAQDLSSIQDGTMSHVLASYVLFAVPEPCKALAEILRVLRSAASGGGVFAMTSWNDNEWWEYANLIETVQPDLKVQSIDQNSVWASVDGARGELEAVGFRQVESKVIEVYMDVDDPVEFPRMMFNIPALAKVMEQMSDQEQEMVCDAITNKLKKDHPEMPARLVGKVILTSGRT